MDLMSLVARLTLDSSEYESGVDKAKLGMLAMIDSAQDMGSKVVSAMESVATTVVNFGKSVWDAASQASTFADDMLTLATQTGLSTTKLQEYGYASRFVDTEVSTITGSLTKLQKNMASGSDEVTAAFDSLGVSVQDSNGHLRNSEDVFWECIDALGKVENSTERDVLAMQLFGKSAKELNPLIEAGSDEWRKYCQEAEDAGLVLSQDGVGALGKFNDSLQRIEATMDAAKNQIFAALAPAFEHIGTIIADTAQRFTTWIQTDEAQEYLSQLTQVVIALADKFLQNLGPAIDGTVQLFSNISDAINFLSEHFDEIIAIVQVFITTLASLKAAMMALQIASLIANPMSKVVLIITAVVSALGLLMANWEQVREVGNRVWSSIESVWKQAGEFFNNIAQNIYNALNKVSPDIANIFQTAWSAVQAVWNNVGAYFKAIWETIKGIFSVVHSVLTGNFQEAWNGIKRIVDAWKGYFQTIWDGIKNVFSNVANTFIGFFTNAWNGIKNVWQTVTGWFSNIVKSVINAFTSIPSKIAQFFSDAWEKVKKAWSDVKSFFGEIPDKIYGVFKSLPERFGSIGNDIVKGLWNGINEMTSWISKKISGFTDTVVSGFKNFFGIKSPSRVMRDEVGKYLGMGIGEGILDEADYVQKAYDALMPDMHMDNNFAGLSADGNGISGSSVAKGSAGDNYTISININGAQYSNEQSLAQAISLELQNIMDRRRAVFA